MYPDLVLPTLPTRPFFYTNFVETLDGKVQVITSEQSNYWPIGSPTDYATLIELRTYADVLIYGKNSALSFNHGQNLAKEDFKMARIAKGENPDITYMIVCNTITKEDLVVLRGPHEKHTILVMPESAQVDKEIADAIQIVRVGKEQVDVSLVSTWLQEHNYKQVLVEGGPRLLGSFLKENLIDEVFLTIAPKIFGNEPGKTLTLVEGVLFPPDKIKNLELLSVQQNKNELFLRYNIIHPS